MKVLILSPGWYPTHGGGGIEIYVKHLVEGLIERKHEVTLITTAHPINITHEKYGDNLEMYYIGDKPFAMSSKFYEESIRTVKKLCNYEYFDVVHTQDYTGYGIYKADILNVPSVVTAHGTPINMIKGILKARNVKAMPQIPKWIRYHFKVAPTLFHKADRIIAVSNELRKDIISQYNIKPKNVVVIPNGIDTDKFRPLNPSLIRQNLNIGENEKIILFVGSISKNKGIHILIMAFYLLLEYSKDIKLVIVGEGPYIGKIKTMVAHLGIGNKVAFTGRIPNTDLSHYYNLADIVVVPSIGVEGFPIVVIEAMACGKPVIASNIGGIPTSIEHLKTGVLVKPGDYKELFNWMLKLLEDEELADHLGSNARKRVVERFSIDKMVEDTIKVYKELCKC